MIEGNRLKFGYGSLTFGCFMDKLRFFEIEPPQEIGSHCPPPEEIDESVPYKVVGSINCLSVELNEAYILKHLATEVKNGVIDEFEFKGFIFDFSHYNVKSVDIVLKAANTIIDNLIRLMAC